MRVEDILRTKGSVVITVHEDTPLMTAVEIMSRKQIGALVVLDAGSRVSGILAERHVLTALAEKGDRISALHVRDAMTRHIVFCGLDEPIKKATSMMAQHNIKHLPVMSDGVLKGIISMTDVVAFRLREVETEAGVLRDIVLSH